MAGSIDHVLQPDGTYKWEVVEPKTEAQKVAEVCPAPEPVVESKRQAVVAEVVNQKDFTAMTKAELEEFGRTIGIELDKRHTKAELISELETFIESK